MSTDLPPEAFTKETLQEAFNWLQDQPEPVKATIHTPERLVSLYRKSQRLKDNDAPVSSKKFIDDLKNLASSLDQFSTNEHTPTIPSMQPRTATANIVPPTVERFHQPQQPPIDFNPQPPKVEFNPPQQPKAASFSGTRVTQTETKKAHIEVTTKTENITTNGIEMDDVTLERIQKVKERFNLGSDTEALRLLVSIGFEKFSQFP